MATGDGLLSRLRLSGGSLTPEELSLLAHLAQSHGNGLVEITARGNLQIRGLTEASAPLFAAAIVNHLSIETGLVVDVSPLSGDDPSEQADPRPLAAAIRAGSEPWWPRLAPKLSVVIDGSGQLSLAALKADIRLVAVGPDDWQVAVGEMPPQILSRIAAITLTLEMLGRLAVLGPNARANALSSLPHSPRESVNRPGGDTHTRHFTGLFQLHAGTTTSFVLPFGGSEAKTLIAFAEAAAGAGVTRLRLAPGHALFADGASQSLIDTAKALGFITDATDPRLRVSACAGSDGCRSGHIAARRLAVQYAPLVSPDRHLHISGCSKGCAHPTATDLTLVGAIDGIGLVIDGRAGDTPQERVRPGGIGAALQRAQEGQ